MTTRAGTRARWTGRGHLFAACMFALAIMFMVNYVAFRHYVQWDWTSTKLFTLSERTKEELRSLSTPVDVYVFLARGETQFRQVQDLLNRYRALSNNSLTVHYVDPDRDPGQYRVLADRFSIGVEALDTGGLGADVAAVLTAGDRKWSVKRSDIVSVDFGEGGDRDDAASEGEPSLAVKAEQAFTGALVELRAGTRTRVCLAAGHGEAPLETNEERSVWAVKDDLRRDNVETATLETAGAREIPPTCDAVFVIGPMRPLSEPEVTLLIDYARAGGRLLLALDPVVDEGRVQPTGFEAALLEFGIRVEANLVLELDPSLLAPPPTPIGPYRVATLDEHAITAPAKRFGGPVVSWAMRVVEVLPGVGAAALLHTSDKAFAKSDLGVLRPDEEPAPGPGDPRGPLSLAAVVELQPASTGPASAGAAGAATQGAPAARRGRIAVFGSSTWLMPEPLRQPELANSDLASSTIGWLTDRRSLLTLPPRRVRIQPIALSEDDLPAFFFRILVAMPAASLLAGVLMWWSRRK